jgi:hypothetical protein
MPKVAAGAVPDRIRVLVKHTLSGTVDVVQAQLMEEVVPSPEDEKKAATPPPADEGKAADAADSAKGEEKNGGADDKEGAAAKNDMDTTEDGKKEEAEVKPKKKYRKVSLKVEAKTVGTSDPKVVTAWLETEAKMTNADKVITETNNMRNSLETYIYSIRDKVIADLRPFVTDEAKLAVEKACEDAENWLYEGDGYDAIKSEYSKRLDSLKELGNPIESRLWQSEKRPAVQAELLKCMADYTSIAASTDSKYSHLNDDDRKVLRIACDTSQTWLYDMLAKQGDTKQSDDPVLTVAMIQEEQKKVIKACKHIATKSKPAPPKPAPEAKAGDKKDSDEKKSSAENVEGVDGDEPMTESADDAAADQSKDVPMDTDMD